MSVPICPTVSRFVRASEFLADSWRFYILRTFRQYFNRHRPTLLKKNRIFEKSYSTYVRKVISKIIMSTFPILKEAFEKVKCSR